MIANLAARDREQSIGVDPDSRLSRIEGNGVFAMALQERSERDERSEA